jgi:6-pyruvoyltetrahydropterin/6-carboxytetrahydropterin synthase
MGEHQVHRYHDFSAGHRVYGHENKCAHLHGHNYRAHFTVVARNALLDEVGRVIDFSEIKTRLCDWIEKHWDHKFIVFMGDPWCSRLAELDPNGVVMVTFNPTAENLANYIVEGLAPAALAGTGMMLLSCTIEETRKCSATYSVQA